MVRILQKHTEKVSFHTARKAIYVYILNELFASRSATDFLTFEIFPSDFLELVIFPCIFLIKFSIADPIFLEFDILKNFWKA